MMRDVISRWFPAMLLLCAGASVLAHSDEPTIVRTGASVSASLEGDQVHTYTMDLEADRFVLGVIDQHDVDAALTLFGPDGEEIGTFDVTALGRDLVRFETEAAGTYRFEISGFEGAEGAYDFTITRVEPVATTGPERVDQLLAELPSEAPGIAIGVFQGGKTLFSRGYALAELEHAVPYTAQTPSNIGSTSKQFTASAIVLLAEQGKLSLDDDVRAHIPELPDLGETVTLRHLISHTSGYREFLNSLALAGRLLGEGDAIARHEIVDLVVRQPELQNVPGDEWNYNNTGYALLTLVVERVTETPFEEWMEANVFAPLGMTSTVVCHPRGRLIPGRARGYVPADGGTYLAAPDLGGSMGAGGIYASVHDLGRWIRNFKTQDLGGEAFFETMTQTFVLNDGNDSGYAKGLFIDEFNGLTRVQHGGADVAHRAMLMYFPEIDAGVVTLSNNAQIGSILGPGFADEIAVAFFDEHMESGTEVEEVVTEAEDDASFDPASYEAAWFEPIAGRYELEIMPGFILEFSEEDGTYLTQATGQPQIAMVPTSRTTFVIEEVQARIVFHVDDDGVCDSLTLFQGGEHTATRVKDEPWAPDAEALAAFTGRYFSEELETYCTVVLEEDTLEVVYRRFDTGLTMTPAKADEFSCQFPIGTVRFERNDAGEVVAMYLSNGRTRDVRFERLG